MTSDQAESPEHPKRHIRSFVLRQGRMTDAQERAFGEYWQRFGLEYRGALRDFDAEFGRAASRVLEIGFGNGEQLRSSAAADPGRDYIGIEVHRPGVGRVLNSVAADNSTNVRVYNHDAVEVLATEIAPGSLAEIRIWFPDPWPKKRHHKRRLVQPGFIALAASRLQPGGRLHLATDWAEYASHMLEVLDACAALRNSCGRGHYAPQPDSRGTTHFERRGVRLGHGVWDVVHVKCADAGPASG